MSFENWINKTEDNKTILEKAQEELVYNRYTDNHSFWQKVLYWLKLAYTVGYLAGKKEISKKELV